MKLLRPVLAALFLPARSSIYTTYSSGPFRPWNWMGRSSKVEITEAPEVHRLDSEEQNNIGVYHKNIGAIVNIPRERAFDFFYGCATEGQGSGFIIDKKDTFSRIIRHRDARQVELRSMIGPTGPYVLTILSVTSTGGVGDDVIIRESVFFMMMNPEPVLPVAQGHRRNQRRRLASDIDDCSDVLW